MYPPFETEIVQLHYFFQEWFRGEIPATETVFCRFSEVLHQDFIIISPSGKLNTKAETLSGVKSRYGKLMDISIWIENVQLRYQDEKMALVTYEEWQTTGEKTTARISSITFLKENQAPNGLHWFHLQETWKSR
jgi:hypothetical protein